MAKKRHVDNASVNILRMKAYEMAPKMVAAFALVRYEQTDMTPEQIGELCNQVAPLYERAEQEGWDIRQNCKELLDLDVYHYMERGKA